MSYRNRCRTEAAKAVGILGQVRKVKGNIIVLRRGNGRTRDWQRAVRRAVLETLPNWEMVVEAKDMIEFKCLLKTWRPGGPR